MVKMSGSKKKSIFLQSSINTKQFGIGLSINYNIFHKMTNKLIFLSFQLCSQLRSPRFRGRTICQTFLANSMHRPSTVFACQRITELRAAIFQIYPCKRDASRPMGIQFFIRLAVYSSGGSGLGIGVYEAKAVPYCCFFGFFKTEFSFDLSWKET